MRVRQEDILAAAAKLFAAKGYQETTMKEIADAVGVQKATLYAYIPSKEALLAELLTENFLPTVMEARRITELPVTPREKLRTFVYRYVTLVLDRQEMVTIFFRERKRLPPEHQKRLLVASRELEGYVDQIIREGQEQGYFRPLNPLVLRQSLFGMINWLVEWYRKEGRLNPLTIADSMVDMLLWGWASAKTPSQG